MLRSKADIDSKDAENAIRRIGVELRRLRTKRNERLEDVAEYLEIKSTYLYGIEQGDLSVIPSKHNVRSFTSSYANYLGLDGDAIMKQLSPVIHSLEGNKAPSGFWNLSGLDRGSAVILASSVMLGVVAGWLYLGGVAKFDLFAPPVTAGAVDEVDETVADAVIADETVADETIVDAAIANETVADAAIEDIGDITDIGNDVAEGLAGEAEQALANLEIQAAQAQSAGISESPASSDFKANSAIASNLARTIDGEQASEGSSRGEALPANVLATLVAERGDGAEIYEPENTDARVIVRALDTSWIQVSSRDRTYLWTRTMQPREMLLVPNRNDLELWAGDASGVEILLDGAALPKLGPPGTVVRGVSLAPDALAAISDTTSGEESSKQTF